MTTAAANKPGAMTLVDERWATASGLASLKPGFCFAPDYDRLFALGWPHIRFLVDAHREDENPPASALRILTQPDPPLRFAWPRKVSQGLVRAWGLPSIFELAPGVQDIRMEAMEACWKPDPITVLEASGLINTRMTQDISAVSDRGIECFVLLLEAMLGAENVGALIIETLEQLPADDLLAEWTLPPQVTWHLGFLLLRVPKAVAEAWRVRMYKVLEAAFELRPTARRLGFRGAGSSHARALHLVLNGGVAVENSSDRSVKWYAQVMDNPVLVRMRVSVNRLAYEPDARLAFVGGLDVLERYGKDWPNLGTTESQRWFFEQVAPIKAPQMRSLMLEMAGRSRVRPEVMGWFVAHQDYTRDFLEEVAGSDGTAANYARQVRKALALA